MDSSFFVFILSRRSFQEPNSLVLVLSFGLNGHRHPHKYHRRRSRSAVDANRPIQEIRNLLESPNKKRRGGNLAACLGCWLQRHFELCAWALYCFAPTTLGKRSGGIKEEKTKSRKFLKGRLTDDNPDWRFLSLACCVAVGGPVF